MNKTVFIPGVVSLLIASVCMSQTNPSATSDISAIKLGVIQSLTGAAEEDGRTIVRAVQLAADEINARGDVRVSLLIEDDATQPKNSVTSFNKLRVAG